MPRAKRLPRVHRYSLEFKLSAVRLSKLRGVQVQQVADALDIQIAALCLVVLMSHLLVKLVVAR